jgi:hypothetical protein
MDNVVSEVLGVSRKESSGTPDGGADFGLFSATGAKLKTASLTSSLNKPESVAELVVTEKNRIGSDGKETSDVKARAKIGIRGKLGLGSKVPLAALWKNAVHSKEFEYLSVPRIWIFGGLNVGG